MRTHTTLGRTLWTSDQPDAETSTCPHIQHSQETYIYTTGGIRTHNPSKRAAADLRLRLRGATGVGSSSRSSSSKNKNYYSKFPHYPKLVKVTINPGRLDRYKSTEDYFKKLPNFGSTCPVLSNKIRFMVRNGSVGVHLLFHNMVTLPS
jgi:hypothetical protein